MMQGMIDELRAENLKLETKIEQLEAEVKALKNDSLFLSCLEASGVDNWDWYGEALASFQELKENG